MQHGCTGPRFSYQGCLLSTVWCLPHCLIASRNLRAALSNTARLQHIHMLAVTQMAYTTHLPPGQQVARHVLLPFLTRPALCVPWAETGNPKSLTHHMQSTGGTQQRGDRGGEDGYTSHMLLCGVPVRLLSQAIHLESFRFKL
jgi:hypothetical protein